VCFSETGLFMVVYSFGLPMCKIFSVRNGWNFLLWFFFIKSVTFLGLKTEPFCIRSRVHKFSFHSMHG